MVVIVLLADVLVERGRRRPGSPFHWRRSFCVSPRYRIRSPRTVGRPPCWSSQFFFLIQSTRERDPACSRRVKNDASYYRWVRRRVRRRVPTELFCSGAQSRRRSTTISGHPTGSTIRSLRFTIVLLELVSLRSRAERGRGTWGEKRARHSHTHIHTIATRLKLIVAS